MTPQQIDTSMQTNFVPKAPSVAPGMGGMQTRKKKPSAVLSVGIFLFLAAGLFVGGLYGFLYFKNQDVATLEQSLAQVEQQVDAEVLAQVEEADAKLKLAKALYDTHTMKSSLLTLLEEETLPDVAYDGFSYDGSGLIRMNGTAASYEAIAQQSDLFSTSPAIVDHIFSGFQLTQTGLVRFQLEITPIPELTLYASSQ